MAGSVSRILVVALLLRLLLIPLNLYRSTDFEVHRNWLAITHSLPLSRWYYEATSQWTLDYPPVFAYFEWALSQAAQLVDPEMLNVQNLEYMSKGTIIFQRLSVILGDTLLCAGVWRVARVHTLDVAATLAVVLFNPCLLIVDHIHFQYNGMLLGLLLLSAADIESGHTYRGAAIFCVLVNMKQIFLYVAPVYFVYLLRGHCGCAFTKASRWGFDLRFSAFARLAALVITIFAVSWAPMVFTGQVLQAGSRLFPFGRGLTHAYWAPNVWALYNTADRVLAKLPGLGGKSGHSSTAGFAEVYESSALWTIPPKVTFILTVIAYVPLFVAIWQHVQPVPQSSSGGREFKAFPKPKSAFTLYVALGCAISFCFGWHVHEKAILMVTIPLLAASARTTSQEVLGTTAILSVVGTFSCLPLLPPKTTEMGVKWAMLVVGHSIELCLLSKRSTNPKGKGPLALLMTGPLPGYLLASMILFLGMYCDLGGHRIIFKGRMEFLPLLLMSDFSAIFVLYGFTRLYILVVGIYNVDNRSDKST